MSPNNRIVGTTGLFVWFVAILFSYHGRYYYARALTATRFNDYNNKFYFYYSSSSPVVKTRKRCSTSRSSSRGSSSSEESPPPEAAATTTTCYSGIVTKLDAKYRRRSYQDDDNEEYSQFGGEIARQRSSATDRPTQTVLDVYGPPIFPGKPKIVVLGATGKIGRLVVKELLSQSVDMTVVALVRDYDKAVKVLYDDMGTTVAANNNNNKGPKLEIVQGDLVPREELPGFAIDEEEESIWLEKAEAATKFYDGTTIEDYDNREDLPDINESLELAIKDATTIISCVGSVRPTNIWTDIIARPFSRILRADVSRWCTDGRHPYYVHYASTRKALGFAEREQLRREAAAEAIINDDDNIYYDDDDAMMMNSIPRIRFIRISDLCVSHNPWNFVPLITNMMRSVVFRYQEMAEQLLDQSTLIETVILRPGDLVDEERDVNSTSLQVCSSGAVPQPARVGREDVANLAVASALFTNQNTSTTSGISNIDDGYSSQTINEPFHYTLACRWVGEELDPYPSQGKKADGKIDAQTALQLTLKQIYREEKRSSKLHRRRRRKGPSRKKNIKNQGRQLLGDYYSLDDDDDEDSTPKVLLRLAQQKLAQRYYRRRPKPHGLCVAIPTYVFLCLSLKTMIWPLLHVIPGGKTWILPILYNLNEKFVMIISIMMGRLVRLVQLPPWWIIRRPKQYIFL